MITLRQVKVYNKEGQEIYDSERTIDIEKHIIKEDGFLTITDYVGTKQIDIPIGVVGSIKYC